MKNTVKDICLPLRVCLPVCVCVCVCVSQVHKKHIENLCICLYLHMSKLMCLIGLDNNNKEDG